MDISTTAAVFPALISYCCHDFNLPGKHCATTELKNVHHGSLSGSFYMFDTSFLILTHGNTCNHSLPL